MNKIFVNEPLTPIQEQHLLDTMQYVRQYIGGIHSTDAYATAVAKTWDTEHLKYNGPGLGGFMKMEIAASRIEKLRIQTISNATGPATYHPLFPIAPNGNFLAPPQAPVPLASATVHPSICPQGTTGPQGTTRNMAFARVEQPANSKPKRPRHAPPSKETKPSSSEDKSLSRLALKDLGTLSATRVEQLVQGIRGGGETLLPHDRNLQILQEHIRSKFPAGSTTKKRMRKKNHHH
jgi:hypothetical protein